ncbi:MAG: phytoene desaturase family protein, partial [Acidimicrobiales bacterium]
NGLTCATYLAREGLSVLVLEARDQLGGACTLETPFPDKEYVVSPCAYLLGLLDQRVIDELSLQKRGLEYYVADPEAWTPFEDGTAFSQWVDDEKTAASLSAIGVSPADQAGYWAYGRLFDGIRRKLRTGTRDCWEGESPSRGEIEELLGRDQTMLDVVFTASIGEVLDDFISDSRLKDALFGGGIIGTYAGPRDPGTASVKLMHRMGDLDGRGPVWAYVRGGMGMVSFILADAAREAGAVLAAGVPVGHILAEGGVLLEDGTQVFATEVVSNADPKVLARLVGDSAPDAMRKRLEGWDVRSATVKLNAALDRLPSFTAAPDDQTMAFGAVDLTTGLDETQRAFERCKEGETAVAFWEVYFQTAHDPSVAPEGRHLISIFAQYAPYDRGGEQETSREAMARQIIELVERFAPGLESSIEHYEVLGPADIEARHRLSGGNIFQGSVLPHQMWENRLSPRTEMDHVYLCGAATHPAGSVIGLNGRNAAAAVLKDRTGEKPGWGG